MDALAGIDGLIAAKLTPWTALIQARAAALQPYLGFWLWAARRGGL